MFQHPTSTLFIFISLLLMAERYSTLRFYDFHDLSYKFDVKIDLSIYIALLNFEARIVFILQFLVMFQFAPTSLTLDAGITRPPPLLSEADLLSCMDKVRSLKCFCLTKLIMVSMVFQRVIILNFETFSTLLHCKAGIGTDATMHDHIKKLLDRFYATKDSNTRFSPTNLVIYFSFLFSLQLFIIYYLLLNILCYCICFAYELGEKLD